MTNLLILNSVPWQLLNHACASISTTIATAYDTLGVDGLTHSLNEPDCPAIFTNSDLLPTLARVIANTPKLKWILYDGEPAKGVIDGMKLTREDIQFLHLNELRMLGRVHDEEFKAILEARRPTPDTVACIMYTSGSTGAPKGVCITHGNLIASVSSVSLVFGPHVPKGDIYLSYLPLAHVLEYIVELCAIFVGVTCGYARPKTLTDAGVKGCRGDLVELKPQIMFGVPSVWETIRKGIIGKLNTGGAVKRALFYGALEAKKRGTPVLSGLGERVVLTKVREVTGGKLKFAMNGGAPISKDTQEFLSIALMPMMQGLLFSFLRASRTAPDFFLFQRLWDDRILWNVHFAASRIHTIWRRGPSCALYRNQTPGCSSFWISFFECASSRRNMYPWPFRI